MKLMNATCLGALLLLPLGAMRQDAHDNCPMMRAPQAVTHENLPASGLSDEQRAQYLNGEGTGLARAAELNHYPGPRHVLDNAEKLQLSSDQLVQTRALFEEVHALNVVICTAKWLSWRVNSVF